MFMSNILNLTKIELKIISRLLNFKGSFNIGPFKNKQKILMFSGKIKEREILCRKTLSKERNNTGWVTKEWLIKDCFKANKIWNYMEPYKKKKESNKKENKELNKNLVKITERKDFSYIHSKGGKPRSFRIYRLKNDVSTFKKLYILLAGTNQDLSYFFNSDYFKYNIKTFDKLTATFASILFRERRPFVRYRNLVEFLALHTPLFSFFLSDRKKFYKMTTEIHGFLSSIYKTKEFKVTIGWKRSFIIKSLLFNVYVNHKIINSDLVNDIEDLLRKMIEIELVIEDATTAALFSNKKTEVNIGKK